MACSDSARIWLSANKMANAIPQKRRTPNNAAASLFCADCDKAFVPGDMRHTQRDGRVVCSKCQKRAKDTAAKKRQPALFGQIEGSQGALFNNPARRRNIAGYRDEFGVFHPLRSGMEQRTTRGGGKKLVQSKVEYNEFLTTDVDSPAERKKRLEEHDDRKRRAGYAELEREMKKTGNKDKRRSLAQFVRKEGGIAPGKSKMFAGELQRLGRKESGTTGLLNQHNKQGRQSYTAEYMMDAANEAGYRDAKGREFSSIGDFIGALEGDATGNRKLYSYADNPKRTRNAATQSNLSDNVSVSRAQPVKRLQRVRETSRGEKGTVVKTFPDGWLKIKLDNGGHWLVSPDVVERINPGKNRVVITAAAPKRNGWLKTKIVRTVKRRRAVKRAGRAYQRELNLEATLSDAKHKRLAAEKAAVKGNPASKSMARKNSEPTLTSENIRENLIIVEKGRPKAAKKWLSFDGEFWSVGREGYPTSMVLFADDFHHYKIVGVRDLPKYATKKNPSTNAFTKLVDRALVLLRKHNDLAHAKAQLEKAGERPQRAARAVAAAQSRLYIESTARNPSTKHSAKVVRAQKTLHALIHSGKWREAEVAEKKYIEALNSETAGTLRAKFRAAEAKAKRGKNPSIDAIAKLTGAVLNGLEIHKRLTKPKRKQAATKAAWRSNPLDSDARAKGYAPVAPESVKNLFREFHGREPSGNAMQLYVPNGAPAHTSVIGALVEIGLESDKPIRFAKTDDAALKNPGAYLLQAERGDRRRLYAGLVKPFERMKNGAKIPRDYDYGLARHVVYWAQKPHLENDNKWRAYIHELGEEGGRQPKVKLYKNGRVGFLGGDYTIEARGIVN